MADDNARPEPTDFDRRAFALDKAVQTHGYGQNGEPGDLTKVSSAFEVYDALLQNGVSTTPGVCSVDGTLFDPTKDFYITVHERKGPSVHVCSLHCATVYINDED